MAMAGGAGGGAMVAQPIAMDPEQAKKEELESNPEFKKVLKALKMGIPAMQIRNNMRIAGKFDPDDLILFCSSDQIMMLKKNGDYDEKAHNVKKEAYAKEYAKKAPKMVAAAAPQIPAASMMAAIPLDPEQ